MAYASALEDLGRVSMQLGESARAIECSTRPFRLRRESGRRGMRRGSVVGAAPRGAPTSGGIRASEDWMGILDGS
jgi:hypothetical protein